MLFDEQRRVGTRYAFSFMIPMLYEGAQKDTAVSHGYRVSNDRLEQENLFKKEIQHDVKALKPELIIIYRRDCFWCLPGLTMEDYLLGQPETFPFIQDYSTTLSNEWYLVLKRGMPE
jgi:hypothetical protein